MAPQRNADRASGSATRYGPDIRQQYGDLQQFVAGFNAGLQGAQRDIAKSALELAALGGLAYVLHRGRKR